MSRLTLTTAMVLAAGYGRRMRPITDRMPKPMVEVAGATLIDRVLDHLDEAGIAQAVVNTHHKGEMLAAHLGGRTSPKILLSPEDDLLDTGGGVANALPLLGDAPFLVANGDTFWIDGYIPAIHRLANAWDDGRMDALLLFHPTADALSYSGRGDYFLDGDGCARRRQEGEVAPFVFAGVQILHPRLFRDAPAGRFSLTVLFNQAEEAGRLFAIRHDGEWFHVGTPDSITRAEKRLQGLDLSRDWA